MSKVLASFLKKIIRKGTLEVETADGRKTIIGDGDGKRIAIRLEDRVAEWKLLCNPELAFGELYVDGRLSVTSASIYDVVELVCRNLALDHPPGLARGLARLRRLSKVLLRRNTPTRAKQNVAHHYDLDRRLYELFLDSDQQYSCAYFENEEQDLEDAQLAKKRHIAAKLRIQPGHRVLDVGSGWGGLALYLTEKCAANVSGITLSEEQLRVSRQRVTAMNLSSSVEFQLQDYRDIRGVFDRIVSVGMFEHVGAEHYNHFFSKMAGTMTADGIMLLHTIGRIDQPGATNPWIAKYIFPGAYVPALSEVLPSIERAGLIVTDVEILRLHYAKTLRAWRERFAARKRQAIALADERFYRIWEFYLACCEAGFRYGGLVVFQIQLAKSLEAVPLTRGYISQAEEVLRQREGSQLSELRAAE